MSRVFESTSAPEEPPEARFVPDAAVQRSGVALALSGGGFRATLFHAGALLRLAELGLLARITTISAVSGGAIAAGALAAAWRGLERDGRGVFPRFREQLVEPLRAFCARNLRNRMLRARWNPRAWGRIWGADRSITDLLAGVYHEELAGGLTLGDLAAIRAAGGPAFVFGAANLGTGVNFTFGPGGLGDYRVGYIDDPAFQVGRAVAASSSFPLVFPPLVLRPVPGTVRGGSREEDPAVLEALRARMVLTDGGVYDNFGLEPVWKGHETVLCSDGGAPFLRKTRVSSWFLGRNLRAQAVIENQARALRRRWLISSYLQGTYRGAYWGLGSDAKHYPGELRGYTGRVLDAIRAVRTDLDTFHPALQGVLLNHGYLLADAAIGAWHRDGTVDAPCLAPPEPALLDEGAAMTALDGAGRHRLL